MTRDGKKMINCSLCFLDTFLVTDDAVVVPLISEIIIYLPTLHLTCPSYSRALLKLFCAVAFLIPYHYLPLQEADETGQFRRL